MTTGEVNIAAAFIKKHVRDRTGPLLTDVDKGD